MNTSSQPSTLCELQRTASTTTLQGTTRAPTHREHHYAPRHYPGSSTPGAPLRELQHIASTTTQAPAHREYHYASSSTREHQQAVVHARAAQGPVVDLDIRTFYQIACHKNSRQIACHKNYFQE
jgi:hypothetical protein